MDLGKKSVDVLGIYSWMHGDIAGYLLHSQVKVEDPKFLIDSGPIIQTLFDSEYLRTCILNYRV